jgi:AraC-like DNA-binding protein
VNTGAKDLRMADRANRLAIRDTDRSTAPAAAAANVLRAAAARVPADALCSEIGLDPVACSKRDARIPYRQLAALYEAAARLTGDPWFGLHVGAAVDLRNFGLVGYLALTSATLGEAFAQIARYLPLWTTGAGFELHRSRKDVELVWCYADPAVALARHDCEMTIMAAASVGSLLHAGAWQPREVHFHHPAPRDTREHARLLRGPVRFTRPCNMLVCDPAIAELPLGGADPVLNEMLRELADRQLDAQPVRGSIVDDAAALIAKLLPSGDVRISRVARGVGLGARTLQRRLIASGTTFRGLLATLRRDRATDALVHSELPLGEIASSLGYRSAGELHRAFRSWVGVGPAAYRRAHRRQRPTPG